MTEAMSGLEPPSAAMSTVRRRRRIDVRLPAIEPASLVYAGIAVAAVGIGCITLAWGRVAGEPQIYRQLPYLVSGGAFGLVLVIVGAALVTAAGRLRDERARQARAERVEALFEELVAAVRKQAR